MKLRFSAVYFLVSLQYFRTILSFKLSRSRSFPRFKQKEEKHKTPFLAWFLGIPLVALPVRAAWHYLLEQLLRGTRQTTAPSRFFLPCTEEKAIKRESARLSVFIPSHQRFPGCYANSCVAGSLPRILVSLTAHNWHTRDWKHKTLLIVQLSLISLNFTFCSTHSFFRKENARF